MKGVKDMPDKEKVGERLKRLRGHKSRAVVASDLGVTPHAIWLWEHGLRTPRDSMKAKLASYYRRSVSGIFYKEGNDR